MRTTITIDDDVLAAAKDLASTQNKTIGEVISGLARRALRPDRNPRRARNGLPLLPVRDGAARVTSEMVQRLREELP